MITIRSNKTNYLEKIEKAKIDWINLLLDYVGVDLDVLHSYDLPRQVEALLEQYKIEIITKPGIGALRIIMEGEVIGTWGSPSFLLKTNLEAGYKYYEITVETWTLMDEEIAMN